MYVTCILDKYTKVNFHTCEIKLTINIIKCNPLKQGSNTKKKHQLYHTHEIYEICFFVFCCRFFCFFFFFWGGGGAVLTSNSTESSYFHTRWQSQEGRVSVVLQPRVCYYTAANTPYSALPSCYASTCTLSDLSRRLSHSSVHAGYTSVWKKNEGK